MTVRVMWAVLRRPSLWPTALGQLARMVPSRWWRRRPFLPLPDRAYVDFRLHTMYGDRAGAGLAPDDLVAYLRWCRAFPRPNHPRNARPGEGVGK
jgi:hypothetical protein